MTCVKPVHRRHLPGRGSRDAIVFVVQRRPSNPATSITSVTTRRPSATGRGGRRSRSPGAAGCGRPRAGAGPRPCRGRAPACRARPTADAGVHRRQRRLAVRHRLQHRHRTVGVAHLAEHQPVRPIPQRVLHLLARRDRTLALVVRQALLPRLDVRVQHRVEEVELGGVLDDHHPRVSGRARQGTPAPASTCPTRSGRRTRAGSPSTACTPQAARRPPPATSPRPTRSASVTLPSVLRRSANETCCETSRVAARRSPSPRRITSSGAWLLNCRSVRPAVRARCESQAASSASDRPQPLVDLLDRPVRAVDEHQVEAGGHDLLDRGVGQHQARPGRVRPTAPAPARSATAPHRPSSRAMPGAEPLGVDALTLVAQHLDRRALLACRDQGGLGRTALGPSPRARARPARPASARHEPLVDRFEVHQTASSRPRPSAR